MNKELRVWQAFVMGARAFADSLEEILGAFAENTALQNTECLPEQENTASSETEPTKETSTGVEQEPEPTEDTPSETASDDEPEKEITLPEIRAFLAEKSRAGFTDEVKELLKAHGSSKLSSIDPTEYAAIMKEAEEFGS